MSRADAPGGRSPSSARAAPVPSSGGRPASENPCAAGRRCPYSRSSVGDFVSEPALIGRRPSGVKARGSRQADSRIGQQRLAGGGLVVIDLADQRLDGLEILLAPQPLDEAHAQDPAID